MKKFLTLILTIVCTVPTVQSQVYNQIDPSGNITQVDPNDPNRAFNPNSRDSTHKNKEVPKGVWAWTVDRRFGDITPTAAGHTIVITLIIYTATTATAATTTC